jgi:hypothetical protein
MSAEWDAYEVDPAEVLRQLNEPDDDGYTGVDRLGLDRVDAFALRMALHEQVAEREDPDFEAMVEREHEVDAIAERIAAEGDERERMAEDVRTGKSGTVGGMRVAARTTLPPLTADERQARMAALISGEISIERSDDR